MLRGIHSLPVLFEQEKKPILTCFHLWHQREILAAATPNNCVWSQKQVMVGGGGCLQAVFWPPRQSCKPACSAVMVFVLAWLPSALGAGLYYPAGSWFIMAALLSSANFLRLLSACLLSKITKESSRAEPSWWCNSSKMSWDTVQTHLLLEEQYWLVYPGLGGGKWTEKSYMCCCFINGNNYGNGASCDAGSSLHVNWSLAMKCGGDQ